MAARQVGVTISLNQAESFQHGMKGENNIVISRDTKMELSSLLWAINFVGDENICGQYTDCCGQYAY
jgi:hypothetical protein